MTLNCRTVISLLVGMLNVQIFTGLSSLAVEPQSTITARSCAGLGNSLTKDDIELRGSRLGYALDANTMGAAFENFVLDSLQILKNTTAFYSPARQGATTQSGGVVHSFIIPESVGAVLLVEVNTQGTITYSRGYDDSVFHEVKFTKGNIYLSSFEHQITGYVDVARRSPAGIAPSSLADRRPTPGIEFVTTSDTTIGLSVITKATQERIAIFQRIACDSPSTPSPTDMVVGIRILLNPEVYQGSFPATFRGSGIVARLRR